MKTDTSDKIISYISEKKQASPKDLVDFLLISPQALFRQLKKLQEQNLVTKIGRPPRVLYSLASSPIKEQALVTWEAGEKTIIDREFLHVTPRGELLFGTEGFVAWCYERKLDPQKTSHEYVATLQKYDQFKNNGLIDGLPKMKTTFVEVFLGELYYLDFYSIERFGKTRLGTLLLLAKQTQDKTLMQQIFTLIIGRIIALIQEKEISGVCFVPPTIPRNVQFQKELDRALSGAFSATRGVGQFLPRIHITKITGTVAIPQKSLSRLDDRVENARTTMLVTDSRQYGNVLIIDDAVGSGATMNELARKLHEKGIVSGKIIGLAITGSFKGFDVVQEV